MTGRVLIVEDDVDARSLLIEALGLEGHECVAVASAESALRAHPETFDVVLTDHDLGGGATGLELLRSILAEGLLPAERVALCTAECVTPPPQVAYFQKPLRIAELRAFINACLRSLKSA